jgi:hypothetical protein
VSASPKSSRPKKLPATGCKKKNSAAWWADIKAKPLFQQKAATAVDMIPG